jgi:hypothetical protein
MTPFHLCEADPGYSTDVFPLRDYQKALDKMSSRAALKIAIRPGEYSG